MFPPERIVCLTEETVETLYLLGEQHRIVGVSGYAVRPARVRKEKPRVLLTYPYDWGFIPSTKAEDGDPLDVLIIHDAATYPGLVLTCKPIGVLEVLQSSKGKNERNDRVFVLPDRSPFEGDLRTSGGCHRGR